MEKVELVTFTGGNHLAYVKNQMSLCKRTAPFWYRAPWDGTSKGICKRCIKIMTKEAVAEQKTRRS